jgi:hypothetical protein
MFGLKKAVPARACTLFLLNIPLRVGMNPWVIAGGVVGDEVQDETEALLFQDAF